MKFRTKVAALATIAAVSGVAGIAFAAWNSTVDGTGKAQSTTSDNGTGDIDFVAAVNDDDDLYPGAQKWTYVTITNDNDYPIKVTKIYAGWSREVNGCGAGSVRTDEKSVAGGIAQNGTTETLIARKSSAVYQLQLRMSNNAANECKSQDFVIGDALDSTAEMHADVVSAASANNF